MKGTSHPVYCFMCGQHCGDVQHFGGGKKVPWCEECSHIPHYCSECFLKGESVRTCEYYASEEKAFCTPTCEICKEYFNRKKTNKHITAMYSHDMREEQQWRRNLLDILEEIDHLGKQRHLIDQLRELYT